MKTRSSTEGVKGFRVQACVQDVVIHIGEFKGQEAFYARCSLRIEGFRDQGLLCSGWCVAYWGVWRLGSVVSVVFLASVFVVSRVMCCALKHSGRGSVVLCTSRCFPIRVWPARVMMELNMGGD